MQHFLIKSILIIIAFSLTSCVFFMPRLRIDNKEVQEITILNMQDSLSIVISDPVVIEDLLDDCLNGARRVPVKFRGDYKLTVKEKDTSYQLIVNGHSINRGGTTYQSGCDAEKTIRALFR